MTLEDVLRAPLPGRVADVVERLQAIEETLPEKDGVRAFTALYRAVTEAVDERVRPGTFAEPKFTRWLDVVFANLYLRALKAHVLGPKRPPRAWAALFEARSRHGIAPIQFALAGMNAHINHDLPLALVATCTTLATSPDAGAHYADYQKVDQLLDAAEQSVRESFESAPELAVDHHLIAVNNLVASWTINSARDLAWNNCLLLWAVRDDPIARGLLADSLAASAALASRLLLVEV
jgi:hypothetical protein